MIVCVTNLLFPALEVSHASRGPTHAWLESMVMNPDFALCVLVLIEVYTLLRNPVVCTNPLTADEAVRKIDNLRLNPSWLVLDCPGPGLMNGIWQHARTSDSVRRIYDIPLALTLRHYNVTDFVTANGKHFQGFGFSKVWNPLSV